MNTLTILFVRRPWWHIGGAIIRWALPVSRFKWARAGHSMIVKDGFAYHATMRHGVVKEPIEQALHGQTVVAQRDFEVLDAPAALAWLDTQVGKPYDWRGALGVSLSPDRVWGSDDSWFCHELCAAALRAAGRNLFIESGHVNDSALLLIEPSYAAPKAC
jgi:hypothetical protein|tara:strand:- start:429 stop:908 length:480 start_codon:yes stop_codon:yes gene_type:complete